MNLQSMTLAGHEPAAIMAALRRHFTITTQRRPGAVYAWLLEASDDSGRVRLRLIYFFNAREWAWVYDILPGDRL